MKRIIVECDVDQKTMNDIAYSNKNYGIVIISYPSVTSLSGEIDKIIEVLNDFRSKITSDEIKIKCKVDVSLDDISELPNPDFRVRIYKEEPNIIIEGLKGDVIDLLNIMKKNKRFD